MFFNQHFVCLVSKQISICFQKRSTQNSLHIESEKKNNTSASFIFIRPWPKKGRKWSPDKTLSFWASENREKVKAEWLMTRDGWCLPVLRGSSVFEVANTTSKTCTARIGVRKKSRPNASICLPCHIQLYAKFSAEVAKYSPALEEYTFIWSLKSSTTKHWGLTTSPISTTLQRRVQLDYKGSTVIYNIFVREEKWNSTPLQTSKRGLFSTVTRTMHVQKKIPAL